MTPAARIAAAVEVLADVIDRRRPAADALKDWGLSNRFAGSGDRAGISALVHDALRRRASAAWIMGGEQRGGEGTRALVLGGLRLARGLDVDAIAALCTGERHAPAPLTEGERARLEAADLADAPAHVLADVPEWLAPSLEAAFGAGFVEEGRALGLRAPLDLRANALKGARAEALERLAHFSPAPTPLSPYGVRIAPGPNGRAPALTAEPAFLKGLVEVQDEGSQLAASLSLARPGEQVVDLCAGAGGKTLALAALMGNAGQVFATDLDARRLAPLYERAKRAGVRNLQVRTPRQRGEDGVADLAGRADLVLVDAPCTGVGAWRRNPDAKWRVRPGALEQRVQEQDHLLDRALGLARPGGRVCYITCSLLPQENDARIEALLARRGDAAPMPPAELVAAAGPAYAGLASQVSPGGRGLLLSPHRTGTDGFFVAMLTRR